MKIKLIFILSFFSALSSAFGQEVYKQDLLNLVTINFPSKPVASDVSGKKVFYLTDSTAHYLVVIQDLTQEAGFELKSDELSEFYEGNIKGQLKASNGELISKKLFETNGLKGIDFVFKTPPNPKVPELRFNRVLFLNDIVFSISFLVRPGDEAKTQVVRDKFFHSLEITADKGSLNQGTKTSGSNHSTAFNIGYVLGQIIFYALLAGGVIFLIRKMTKKKTV